ncbi:hypothetical protein M0R45_036988 [Rubus argutus]|uniref:Uncharacterized protein n=1 Tax=Rubus argutus TaxID=59490 RepID=A0AAW1VXN2_RUBAR
MAVVPLSSAPPFSQAAPSMPLIAKTITLTHNQSPWLHICLCCNSSNHQSITENPISTPTMETKLSHEATVTFTGPPQELLHLTASIIGRAITRTLSFHRCTHRGPCLCAAEPMLNHEPYRCPATPLLSPDHNAPLSLTASPTHHHGHISSSSLG